MTNLLAEIKEGITISHYLSREFFDLIYIDKSDPIRIDINALEDAIFEKIKARHKITEIDLIDVDWFNNNSVNGLVIYENNSRAVIYINERINECWQRFTILKELFQIYIDGPPKNGKIIYSSDEIISQIEHLVEIQNTLFLGNHATIGKMAKDYFSEKTANEMRAIVAAIDFIFPLKHKKFFDEIVLVIISMGDMPTYDLAKMLMMPENIVINYINIFNKYSIGLMNGDE